MVFAMVAFGTLLAQTPACTQPAYPKTQAPAVLPAVVSAAYPNGISIRYKVVFDASDRIVSEAIDDSALQTRLSPAARAAATSWMHGKTFMAPFYDCKWTAGPQYIDVDFFPTSSGVVGHPHVIGGVDFDNFHYTDGPGNCSKADLHDGEGTYPEQEYDASIQDAFAGTIAGTPVAIVVLRCEYNGHGFDMNAQLFDVSGGRAHRLGIIGSDGMTGPDSGFPPWPGGSFHFAFANGKLYADVWDFLKRCDKTHDWVATTYTIRAGKLVKVGALRHHRAGGDACDF